MATPEENKAVIRRLVEGFWGRGDTGAFDEAFADAFIDRTPMPGTEGTKAGFKQAALGLQAAFTGGQTTLDDLVAEGDRVAWRWTYRGTHTGELMGVPATGKAIAMTGITLDRFAGGRIVERWSQVDNLGMLQQLGVIPAPGQAG
jgi:steroid delta-isomerase-like uncharacterized protein